MRLLAARDVEGVTGIMDRRQANGDASRYEEGRRPYTEEIDAAMRDTRTAACA